MRNGGKIKFQIWFSEEKDRFYVIWEHHSRLSPASLQPHYSLSPASLQPQFLQVIISSTNSDWHGTGLTKAQCSQACEQAPYFLIVDGGDGNCKCCTSELNEQWVFASGFNVYGHGVPAPDPVYDGYGDGVASTIKDPPD